MTRPRWLGAQRGRLVERGGDRSRVNGQAGCFALLSSLFAFLIVLLSVYERSGVLAVVSGSQARAPAHRRHVELSQLYVLVRVGRVAAGRRPASERRRE